MGITVGIVNYGMGNLFSVMQALREAAKSISSCEHRIEFVQTPEELSRVDRVVLPGQGAIQSCIDRLNQSGMREVLEYSLHNKPVFGVCVGMQMLMERSFEGGEIECLNFFRGDVKRFPDQSGLKIPHMGWNQVYQSHPHPIWKGIPDGSDFYFVHSYFVHLAHTTFQIGRSHYGIDFTSAVGHDNIFATQFHPEKSGSIGLRLYQNFLEWQPSV